MGLDISIIAKECSVKIPREQINNTNLSRQFYRFIQNDKQFKQVEQLLGIDLRILKLRPNSLIYFERVMGEYTYQEYLAELDEDLEKIKLINEASKKFAKEWQEDYETNLKGWIPINEMKVFIKKLLHKINMNPAFYEKMRFDKNNSSYFNQRIIQSSKHNYLDNNFDEDLQSILNWIEFAKEYNVEYVSFDFG